MRPVVRPKAEANLHAAARPIGITWRLTYPMPGAMHDGFKTLAQG